MSCVQSSGTPSARALLTTKSSANASAGRDIAINISNLDA
jgi:hypothetical protein